MMLIQAAAVSVFAQHKPQVVDTLHFDIKLKESDDLPRVRPTTARIPPSGARNLLDYSCKYQG